ncbi:hypothetical protein NPIL_413781 [Nephila pilipes]|uniref:Uncharacterized protein n=1 Tax=Nephila pilipes TaxID=299642 RepID=A0A8X6PUT8_NEPPI|nr:hypothetical protein NPIL_413781 [Nephila pilipes]
MQRPTAKIASMPRYAATAVAAKQRRRRRAARLKRRRCSAAAASGGSVLPLALAALCACCKCQPALAARLYGAGFCAKEIAKSDINFF